MGDQDTLDSIRPRRRAPIIAEMRRREEAHKEAALQRWLNSVPGVHRGFNLDDDIKQDRWGDHLGKSEVAAAVRYVHSGGTRFMLLQGPEGTGKSTLAVTLIAELIQRTGRAAKHVVAPQLLAQFSHPKDGERPLETYAKVPYLVLDDLGAGNGGMTEHQQRSMWALIDARWSDPKLRTILTTNLAVSDQREGLGLKSWLGTPAWARIADDLTQIAVRGQSFRGGRRD